MPVRRRSNGRRPAIRDVAERVQRAGDGLGYRRQLVARSLSDVRSEIAGVLVADLRNRLLVGVVERAGQVPLPGPFSRAS
jgi:DNA-binding LacI/PurR family transcriptional regulator